MPRKTTDKRKKPVGDVTRTARAKAHLERLEGSKGKRLVVDLDADAADAADAAEALGELLSSG